MGMKNILSEPLLLLLFLVLLVLQLQAVTPDSFKCGPGIITPGVTVPKGDIVIEYGNPLEILCILSPEYVAKGRNASQLEFHKRGTPIQPDFVHVVNETTLRLFDKKPAPTNATMYYCKLKADPQHNLTEEPVCLNSVAVGFKPQEVKNFSCVSQNWDNLTCTWETPHNYVKTTYKLFYFMPGRPRQRIFFPCPNNSDVQKNYCFWDQRTPVVYRQPYQEYIFMFCAENAFGNLTQKIKFHHYANVIPSKAANLTILEKTTHSAQIEWAIVFPMQNFPPGVVQKVEYQSQWDARDHWETVDTSHLNIKNSTHRLNITTFKYPNTFYDIRVFMRSKANLEGEERWSQPATITVKTKDTIPGAPPKTDVGSFEVTAGLYNRDVYLYWQQIPEYMYNGENFRYKVIYIKEDGVMRNITPNEITKTYAVFKGLTLNNYHFGIASANKKGLSATSSEIFVPAQSEGLPEPISFTKIAFKNSIYELSWKPPMKSDRTLSYTIFWCDNKMDRPFQCTGYLDWTKVSKNVTIKNITVPEDKIYQFAISANSLTESSGMVWASCTVIHDRGVDKMKSFWINRIGARYIELGWKLECSDRIGVVTGFHIYYCPIVEPQKMDCKGGLMNTTIHGDSNTIHGNITGLIPYTTYKVAIIVITRSGGQGQPSDYQFNTTLEASPDMPPQNVSISKVTNSSIQVSWKPPPSMNGVLRYYEIYFNDEVLKIEGNQASVLTEAELPNLSSFTNYSVSVTACTISCSAKSPPVYVSTAIGRPGIMEVPTVKFSNYSVVLYWKPPSYPAGRLDYYQVMVQMSDNKHNASTFIYNCTDTQKKLDNEDCNSEPLPRTYRVSVRAVNINENNVSLPGPWSRTEEGSCYVTSRGPSKIVMAIIWLCVVFVFSLTVVFISKRVWNKCKNMQDVEVTLPPGLASSIEKVKDQEYHVQMHWPKQQRTEVERKSQNSADQELLLQKKGNRIREGENDQGSMGDGDSSGCSSGHDSVSSSLSSGTRISADSGTEADQRAPSPDVIFSNPESSLSSLRQRIVATSNSNSEVGGSRVERGEPYVKLGDSNLTQSASNIHEEGPDIPFLGYCLVGGNPTKSTPGLGYVGISPTEPFLQPATPVTSSGYVSHPPCWEEIKEPRPIVSSKGYIMTGKIDSPSSYCRLGWEKPNTHNHKDYVPHRQLDFNL